MSEDEPVADNRIGGADDDFGRVEALLRSLSVDDLEPVEPPAGLWDAIEASAGVAVPTTSAIEPPVSLASRRRSPASWLPAPWLLAAAAAVLVVAAGSFALTRQDSDAPVLASARLDFDAETFDPLGADASASVSLVDDEGELRIAFDDARLPEQLAEDADLELWLIEPDSEGAVSDLVSLGVLDADELGSFPVPAGIDPDRFKVVDISIEPHDGDEAHSGRSILRGALEAR